ncbi:MAG: YsnF/AvaK domain-containing protein, partial [Acidobacteriota bacterium]|nr:YsnF/AvaK domain-containing protein [Acidobacteriota bacterium]
MNNNEAKNLSAETINSNAEIKRDEKVIPVIEEEVTIEKRVVESGKVRISKKANEYEKLVDIPLLHEEVSVERIPINQVIAERLPTRYDGDTLIIP